MEELRNGETMRGPEEKLRVSFMRITSARSESIPSTYF